jgi:hypothetical protein
VSPKFGQYVKEHKNSYYFSKVLNAGESQMLDFSGKVALPIPYGDVHLPESVYHVSVKIKNYYDTTYPIGYICVIRPVSQTSDLAATIDPNEEFHVLYLNMFDEFVFSFPIIGMTIKNISLSTTFVIEYTLRRIEKKKILGYFDRVDSGTDLEDYT